MTFTRDKGRERYIGTEMSRERQAWCNRRLTGCRGRRRILGKRVKARKGEGREITKERQSLVT